jgi:two-component system NtrC family sensor kinase
MVHRVLIVDDDEASRQTVRDALKDLGYEVALAANGREALETQQSFDPDVIVSDLNMPEMDGISFLRELKSRPGSPPVIIVTGHSTHDLAVQSLRDGALDYLTKPVDAAHLRNSVWRATERRQLEQDNLRYQRELEEKNRRLEEAEKMLLKHAVVLEQRVERGNQALLETELRYRELFNLANDAIFTIDAASGEILDANLQAERITGYTFEELVSMNERDLYPPDEMDRVKEFADLVEQAECGCGVTGDLPFLTKDGNRLIMSVSCSILEAAGRKLIHRICRDVTTVRKMEADLASYTRSLEGKFSEKHKLLLESQAQLLQAEKMAALGSLVAGVAHEINTPLGSINSNNDIFALTFQKVQPYLKSQLKPEGTNEELEGIMEIVDDAIRTNRMACERIVKIVRSLRNFARLDEAERKKVNIHDGIESTLTLVAHELKRRINVVKEFGAVREIECYPNQLNQVFMNMLVNASQAIEGEGEIRIRTWEEDETVRIAISDNGKGIPPEFRSKVFDPGFTTKQAGLGTGLGLSICLKIIQDHGGRIELESEAGRGTTFTIVLPIQEGAERKANG